MAVCCFVISPGRCGTQWLAHNLKQQLGLAYRVEHEPIHLLYAPHVNSGKNPLKCNGNEIQAHFESIRETLQEGINYAECGYPCWRHISWIASKLKQTMDVDLKVIQIIREPWSNALSLIKINAYVPSILPHQSYKSLLEPDSEGVAFAHIKDVWHEFSSVDKCLYYYYELHHQAQQLEQQIPKGNFLKLRYESMFSEAELTRVVNFLGGTDDPAKYAFELIDDFSCFIVPPTAKKLHPQITELMHNGLIEGLVDQ